MKHVQNPARPISATPATPHHPSRLAAGQRSTLQVPVLSRAALYAGTAGTHLGPMSRAPLARTP
eukprot:4876355-Karenia_brevis.AAC.1